MQKLKAFVRTLSANFNPKGLINFAADRFERQVHVKSAARRTIPGAIPNIWKKNVPGKSSVMSARDRRMVSKHSTFDS